LTFSRLNRNTTDLGEVEYHVVESKEINSFNYNFVILQLVVFSNYNLIIVKYSIVENTVPRLLSTCIVEEKDMYSCCKFILLLKQITKSFYQKYRKGIPNARTLQK
jgi:hypothetical protein